MNLQRACLTITCLALMTTTSFAKAPAASEIQLRLEGKQLHYEYDLSGLFDAALWKVLSESVTNEISVQVQLVDAKGKTRVTQHHWFELTVQKDQRVKVTSELGKVKVYEGRRAMLAELKKVKGAPIDENRFAGNSGYLEIVAMVNPVQVYSYPGQAQKNGNNTIKAQVFHDGRLEIRSASVPR